MRYIVFFLILYFAWIPTALAASSLTTDGWFSVAASHFNFKEFDSAGTNILTEKGLLPGIQAGIVFKKGEWFLTSEIDFAKGEVDYTGQTNIGTPLTTRVDEEIYKASLSAGRWIYRDHNLKFGLQCGVGHRWWWRDIHAAGTVQGLSETYTNWYGLIGALLEHPFSERLSASLSGSMVIPINPTVDVDISNRDNIKLKLQEKIGYRLALALRWQWTETLQIVFRPSFVVWKFGKSQIQPLTWHDVPVGTVYEPDSETQISSIELSVLHTF
jgi:hypothetical protein